MANMLKNATLEITARPMCSSRSLASLGYLFYITGENTNAFEKTEDVPDYITEVLPFIAIIVVIEGCLAYLLKKPAIRLNDGLTSLSQAFVEDISRVALNGFFCALYVYLYNNFRIITLPWDSMWIWWFSFLCMDFVFYWAHRCGHEIRIFWTSHQVHHSSEDFNVTTSLRQSLTDMSIVQVFFMSGSLIVPPVHYVAHVKLTFVYQILIHTQVINKLGPLEYIFNTPSHHRVHHGRNRYCIDKNYGAVLIIWDRIFGTFEEEKEDETGKVAYGITYQTKTFDFFEVQFSGHKTLWKDLKEAKDIKTKLSILFKGPGWSHGKPRLGNIEDVPEIPEPWEKYDFQVPIWCKIYIFLHFIICLFSYMEIADCYEVFPNFAWYGFALFHIVSVINLTGLLAGSWWYAAWLEMIRCFLFFAVDIYILPLTRLSYLKPSLSEFLLATLRNFFLLSTFLWSWICLKKVFLDFHSESVQKLMLKK